MTNYKRWKVQEYDRGLARDLAQKLQVSPLITGILLKRGMSTEEEMREFLFGAAEPYHDPFLMKDMLPACQRILQAVENGEPITVYGDYDVDGMSSSSLLYLYLQSLGGRVRTYIPKRKEEGYGLNSEALQTLYDEGVRLVLTVDTGISGAREVAEAPEGMDIIITDHHTPPEILPAAFAVVNPKQPGCAYPFKDLCGAGIAFKVCQALHKLRHPDLPLWEEITELPALGTVADIVPLKGENRTIVRRGLAKMPTTPLVGLQKLIEVSGCGRNGSISSENIGFGLAPRLNAVGRLEHAQRAVELLVSRDPVEAALIAEELNRENALRQEITQEIFEDAERMLAERDHIDTAIVLAKEGWHAGVIGIVASRLVDKYHLPAILLSIDGDTAKGSCRSIPPLNLYEAIKACSDDLVQFGGHHQAAGLTLERSKIDDFRRHFRQAVAAALKPEDYDPELEVDVVVEPGQEITLEVLEQLSLLEPFGCENPTPVFAMTDTVLTRPRAIGKEKNHLRFWAEEDGVSYQSIMWRGAKYLPSLGYSTRADLAFKPRLNVYMDRESVNLHVMAIAQPLTVYDCRRMDADKDLVLQKFLRTANRLTLFLNPGSGAAERFAGIPQVKVRYYGEHCGPEEDLVVFYEIPCRNIFTEEDFPLAPVEQRRPGEKEAGPALLLLYNQQDSRALQESISGECPDDRHLREAYTGIKKLLDSCPGDSKDHCIPMEEAVAKALELWNLRLSPTDLEIFTEQGYFRLENGIISWGNPRFNKLENSRVYTRGQARRQALEQVLDMALRTSPEDIRNCFLQRRA